MTDKTSFKILFLCQDNTAYGQIAEAFLKNEPLEPVEVFSAGIETKRTSLDPYAIQVMRDIGVDITSQKVKSVESLYGTVFDLVITLQERARDFCQIVSVEGPGQNPSIQLTSVKSLHMGVPMHIHWDLPEISKDSADLSAAFQEDHDALLKKYKVIRDTLKNNVHFVATLGGLPSMVRQRLRFHQALNGLADGIVIHDEFRTIRFFNEEAERITGYRMQDVIGKDCHIVFGDGGLCGSQCSFCQERTDPNIKNTGTKKVHRQIIFTNREGVDKKLRISVAPITMENDRIEGIIISLHDITELQSLRFQLKKERSFHGMVGHSAVMRSIFETIGQVGPSDYPVLITGESGTGKELVASAMHEESRRKGGPFIAVNCGALPEAILESELFGHVKGAFTGAIRDKKGRFELAHKGTIFLDEVGDLSPTFQVKLLRVLQEKRFEPIGGEKTITVDVRIISATNKDLRKLVRDGLFREDLFYRLSVVPIHLPPLRERREDIPHLVEKIMESIAQETGVERPAISNAGLDLIMNYPWPGNVRELINALQFASVSCRGREILPECLPPEMRSGVSMQKDRQQLGSLISSNYFPPTTFQISSGRQMKLKPEDVERVLQETSGNKVKAASALGVGRATLYRFLAKYQHPGNS